MYFLFNKALNSFYGINGGWIPKEAAKKALDKLCVFDNLYDAQSCKDQGRFRGSVMILTEKSMKNKLKLKSKDMSSIHVNWKIGGTVVTSDVSGKKKEQSLLRDKVTDANKEQNKMTFSEYLDQLDDESIYKEGDRKYIQTKLPQEVLNTDLIQETVRYLAMTRKILEMWTDRISVIDSDIHQYDLQISDELHFLELLSSVPDEDLLVCAKRVQEIRRNRRSAKNEKEVGTLFLPMMRNGIDMDKINTLERSIEEMQSRVYRVRKPDAKVNISTTTK